LRDAIAAVLASDAYARAAVDIASDIGDLPPVDAALTVLADVAQGTDR